MERPRTYRTTTLFEPSLEDRAAMLRRTVERMNPVRDRDAYEAVFDELVATEAELKAQGARWSGDRWKGNR